MCSQFIYKKRKDFKKILNLIKFYNLSAEIKMQNCIKVLKMKIFKFLVNIERYYLREFKFCLLVSTFKPALLYLIEFSNGGCLK